ncbi:hypothetical protein BDV40DRAFT_304930 [Aspergillus tamarii]|uniref:Uncharacterized protein n=1 Tax=Aspergillus tamarii TaxID=41984 RepID=A0A5N6UG99_ASPTM|nr:hypothetical protein BDV40DRAFT_304930 [Aspergillus tamarii]
MWWRLWSNGFTFPEAEEYRKFCETATANGVVAIFRTAIHAQSLYLQCVTRTSPFIRSTFDQILEYALERDKEEWGVVNVPKAVTLVYRFHLFDGVFQAWAPHCQRRFGIELDFIQPDTLNRNLMATGVQGRRIIIAGNKYADIIQSVFLKWFSNTTIVTMYAENVYLCPSLYRLTEYQTVHGSADAIAGQGLVNPFATNSRCGCHFKAVRRMPWCGFSKPDRESYTNTVNEEAYNTGSMWLLQHGCSC